MSLLDRIKNGARGLADTKPAKPQTDVELGAGGDFASLFMKEESRKDVVTIADYRKMLDNDGTVEATFNMMTLPIKAANYHFEVKKGGEKELQLVEDNFRLPPHEGGMSLPFDLFLADLLRSLLEGFRLYEKVVTLRDGKYVYKKLAPRDSTTVRLRRDANGGFDGAHQRTWNGTDYVDVIIPTERCFLFTYGKEHSFLYGRSAFKAAHYHYDRKHKLYYLQQLGAQTGAVPPRKFGVPDSVMNDAGKLAAAEAAADDFGVQQRITLPEGYSLEEYKTNPLKLTEDIAHHDALIARSALAQFLVLGQQDTGSYALGKSQLDGFMQSLEGLMHQIEHHVNAYLIPDLINWNFGSGNYPEFKFEDISTDKKAMMAEAFKSVMTRPDVPAEYVVAIVEQMASELGLEVPAAGPAPTAKDKPAVPDKSNEKGVPVSTVNQNSDGQRSRSLSDSYFRQLTDAEKRVNLAEIDKRAVSLEERMTKDASAFYDSLKADTIKRLTALLKKGDVASLKTFELGNFAPYRKMLEAGMMEQYLYGKRTAADEIGGKIPQTPSKSRQFITTQSQAVADKQQSDLTFIVKNEVTKELRTQNLAERHLGIADIAARIASAFLGFQDKNVPAGIAVNLLGSLNLGRGDSFGASDDVDRMQYSAILDNNTTEMCRDLDGSVVTPEEYAATKWIPPVHWGCRSIWVAILNDDNFKPDFQALPSSPGGFTEPQI